MDEDKIKALYEDVSAEYDVGSIDDFKSYLSNEDTRKAFFNEVAKPTYEVESYEEFSNTYGLSVGGDSEKKPESEKVSTGSSEESVSSGDGLTEQVGTSELEDSQSVDLQEDLSPEVFEKVSGVLKSQIESLESELSEQKADVVLGSGGVRVFPRPRNPKRIQELEGQIKQRKQSLIEYEGRLSKSNTRRAASALGEDPTRLERLVEREKLLEGGFRDFMERSSVKLASLSLGGLEIPSEAVQKQKAKERIEQEIYNEVDNASKRISDKYSKANEDAEYMSEKLDSELKITNEAYESGQISYEQYESNYKSLIKGYEEAIKPIQEEFKNLEEYGNLYINSMNDLAVYANYDDLSPFESGVKSAANELIRTPRQIGGLLKATSPAMELLNKVPLDLYGNKLNITQEEYLNALSPVTDWLTERTDKNLLKVDSNEEAANMVGSTAAQLSKIIPASIASPVAGIAVSAGMSFDEMYDTARNTDGISESEAVNLASMYTLIAAPLEYVGARTGVEAFGKNMLKKEAIRIAKKNGLLNLTKEEGARQLRNELVLEFGRGVGLEFLEEGATEVLQNSAMEGIKQLKNIYEGDDVFEFDAGNFVEDLKTAFIYGGLAGGGVQVVAGGVRATSAASIGKNIGFDRYSEALSDDRVYESIRKRVLDDNSITKDERDNALNTMDFDRKTISMIPKSIKGVKRETAARLITEKRILEEENKKIDKALQGESKVRIEEIDKTLEDILTNKKTTQDENVQKEQSDKEELREQEKVNEEALQEGGEQVQEELDITPPEIKMSFPSNSTLRKAKDIGSATTERNRIKEDYKQLKTLIDCLWKK